MYNISSLSPNNSPLPHQDSPSLVNQKLEKEITVAAQIESGQEFNEDTYISENIRLKTSPSRSAGAILIQKFKNIW